MKKRAKLLAKQPTEWELLQKERADITARLEKETSYKLSQDRAALALRLVEIKRALNRLYAAQQ